MERVRRPTIVDVARAAGVSVQTVSRALNGKGEITERTKAAVLAEVERLGYRPNSAARSLQTGSTHTLGLIVPDVANPIFADLIKGVEQRAYEKGFSVILGSASEDPQREISLLRVLDEKQVDGVICCTPRAEDEDLRREARRIRAGVFINRDPAHPNIAVMRTNPTEQAHIATRHLLELGHRVIGAAFSSRTRGRGEEMREGYVKALADSGLKAPATWLAATEPTIEGGREAAIGMMATVSGLTAIVAYSDLVAIGILRACAETGKAVPGDLSVVSAAGTSLAVATVPALTAVHSPMNEIGLAAVDAILAIISGSGRREVCEGCQPILVVRESSGRPEWRLTGMPQRRDSAKVSEAPGAPAQRGGDNTRAG